MTELECAIMIMITGTSDMENGPAASTWAHARRMRMPQRGLCLSGHRPPWAIPPQCIAMPDRTCGGDQAPGRETLRDSRDLALAP